MHTSKWSENYTEFFFTFLVKGNFQNNIYKIFQVRPKKNVVVPVTRPCLAETSVSKFFIVQCGSAHNYEWLIVGWKAKMSKKKRSSKKFFISVVKKVAKFTNKNI
jgi:hypothetical protein